jgi:hypothetical protein
VKEIIRGMTILKEDPFQKPRSSKPAGNGALGVSLTGPRWGIEPPADSIVERQMQLEIIPGTCGSPSMPERWRSRLTVCSRVISRPKAPAISAKKQRKTP